VAAAPTPVQAFYQDFSLEVGVRDWRRPNWRHELLRLYVDELIGRARGLRVLDVGCGAGVMSSFLCRYGDVTGTDFSEPAIRLARALEPRATFHAGPIERLDVGERRFDLVTLFDVLEHVPHAEREPLFAKLRSLLDPEGWLVLSTPHPGLTRWLHEHRPDLLQVVDEPVEVGDIVRLASGVGLELSVYRTYDVDAFHSPQYQFLVLAPPGGAHRRYVPAPGHRLLARLGAASNPLVRKARLLQHAARLVRAGRPGAARWLLVGPDDHPPLSA
jgi:SAM-dependent methyltransferase